MAILNGALLAPTRRLESGHTKLVITMTSVKNIKNEH